MPLHGPPGDRASFHYNDALSDSMLSAHFVSKVSSGYGLVISCLAVGLRPKSSGVKVPRFPAFDQMKAVSGGGAQCWRGQHLCGLTSSSEIGPGLGSRFLYFGSPRDIFVGTTTGGSCVVLQAGTRLLPKAHTDSFFRPSALHTRDAP